MPVTSISASMAPTVECLNAQAAANQAQQELQDAAMVSFHTQSMSDHLETSAAATKFEAAQTAANAACRFPAVDPALFRN